MSLFHKDAQGTGGALSFQRNGPLMVEGFAGEGTSSQQYLVGRRRAARVEAYIITRFHLRPAYVGVIAMGAEPPDQGHPGAFKEGVGNCSVLQTEVSCFGRARFAARNA